MKTITLPKTLDHDFNYSKIISQLEKVDESVVFDCSEISFINSRGLGMIVYAYKLLKVKNLSLILLNANDDVTSIFRNCNFNRIMNIINDYDTNVIKITQSLWDPQKNAINVKR